MKKLLFPLLSLCLAPLLCPGAIRLNEVHLNVPGPDENFEFIELRSTTNGVESLAGLSLVIINNALSDDGVRQNPGEILEVLDLSALSTGTNGLLLLGNGYADSPPGGPWAGSINAATAVGDPTGLGNSDIRTNTGLTILLIRNYNAAVGVRGVDIDIDVITGAGSSPISTGNGIIDWKQSPVPAGSIGQLWADADVIDSIGTRDIPDNRDAVDVAASGNRAPYTSANLFTPATTAATSSNVPDFLRRDIETAARLLGNDSANNANSWYGGQLLDGSTLPTEVVYRTNRYFGPGAMLGEVTPGRPNLSGSLSTTDFRINEVGLNPSGSASADDRYQYVEIINENGAARSLSGYWLLLIDSYDGSADANENPVGVGTIVEEWNLSDFATGPNGLLLLGDGFSTAHTPFQDAVSPNTTVGDPAARASNPASTGWGLGDLRFKDGFTLLLVRGYTPPTAKDLDPANTGNPLVSPFPWTSVSDQIGFSQVGKTGMGRTYSTANLRTVMAANAIPDAFARKAGNLTRNSAAAWYGGNYPGGASSMTLGFQNSTPVNAGDTFAATWFGGFRGAGTPGQPNLSAPIDPAAPPIPAFVRINEVMINPTNEPTADNDANNEYLELVSTNDAIAYLDGLWVLIVDMSGTIGNIQTGFPLNGYTTGTNGLVLLGDGYDNTNGPYLSSQGTLPTNTAAFDPPVGLEGNQFPNNGSAILLVRGIKGPITLNPGGRPIGDLDPENDGTLLASSVYTDELVDSLVVNTINPGPGYAWINSTTLNPHHLARLPGNYTANNPASYYYGQVPQLTDAFPFTNYIGSFVGPFQGAASPGRRNHGAVTGPTEIGDIVINEINVNPAGADNNFEYIELLATNGTARSLNGYTLLAMDNVINNTGAIRHAWSLDGMATGPNGLFLMGNNYPNPLENPWSPVIRTQTRTGDPTGREGLASGLSDNTIANDTDNTNYTFLLVRNFSRYIDYDLDDKTPTPPNPLPNPPPTAPYDSPGDGVFDTFPWAGGSGGIHDSIMFRSFVPTTPPPAVPGPTYPYDGWTYGLPDLTTLYFPNPSLTTFYHPDTISRFRNETSPNDVTSWYGSDLRGGPSGNSGTAEEYAIATPLEPNRDPRPIGFTGRLTPGAPNILRSATADPDSDGIPNLIEQAINTDPLTRSSTTALPMPTIVTNAGVNFLGFSYPRIISAAAPVPFPDAAEAYIYILETSPDLLTWTPDPGTGVNALIPVGAPVPNLDGVTENLTVRLPFNTTTPAGRHFIRLRITRR